MKHAILLLSAACAALASPAAAQGNETNTSVPTASPSASPTAQPGPATALGLPFSLRGNFEFPTDLAGKPDCYTSLEIQTSGSVSGALFTNWCPNLDEPGNYTLSKQGVMPVVVTSACGQNQQIGVAQGVFGGNMTFYDAPTNVTTTPIPVCVGYYLVSQQTRGNAFTASGTKLVTFPSTSVGPSGEIACTLIPEDPQLIILDFSTTPEQLANCGGGTCLNNDPVTCDVGGYTATRDIGIGMSVGAIAMLMVTLGVIVAIPSIVKAQ